MIESFNSPESEEEREEILAERFSDESEPLKVRKIELLQSLGLPTSNMDFFTPENIGDLCDQINLRRQNGEQSLMIRFACVPDRFSMPTLTVEPEDNISELLDNLQDLIVKHPEIKKIILTQFTPEEQAKDKISGRYTLENQFATPVENILELYKGARSTGVLNKANTDDPNFLFFIRESGKQLALRTPKNEGSTIEDGEIRSIYQTLCEYSSKMESAKRIIAKSQDTRFEKLTTIFEFSYLKGRFVFSDID